MKGVTKAVLSLLLIVIVACSSLVVASEAGYYSIYITILDESTDNGRLLLKNTPVSLPAESSLGDTLEVLCENGILKSYSGENDVLNSLAFEEHGLIIATPYNDDCFYLKLNGVFQADCNLSTEIESGDIVEIIFGQINVGAVASQSAQSSKATEFTEAMRSVLNNAASYLDINRENSSSYITAMYAAGKLANGKSINRVVASARNESYDTPTKRNKAIITLSLAGFDAQKLVDEAVGGERISDSDTMTIINTLMAYNCSDYKVYENAANSHNSLKTALLNSQRENGAFGITATSKDDVDVTAMAVTVLSQYAKDDEKAAVAIEKGLAFIASLYSDGSFTDYDETASETLSQYIIALVSNSHTVDQSIIDSLLSYQNADGGFSHLKSSGESNIIATEQALTALGAIKRGGYPYIGPETLTSIEKKHNTIPEAIAEFGDKYSTVSLAGIAVVITAAVIAISFVKKYSSKK